MKTVVLGKVLQTGTIMMVHDAGTIVQLWVRVPGDTPDTSREVCVAGDGNLTRRALADAFGGRPLGQVIDFEVEDWGGLKWFAPVGERSES